MKDFHSAIKNDSGFSLIEIIVVITTSAVAFAVIYSYFGSFMAESSVPIHRLKRAMELKQAAEKITENYRQDPSADLNILKNNLDSNSGAYGQNFTVEINQFVKFISRNDTAVSSGDPEDVLKVKIKHNSTNESLTFLLVQQ